MNLLATSEAVQRRLRYKTDPKFREGLLRRRKKYIDSKRHSPDYKKREQAHVARHIKRLYAYANYKKTHCTKCFDILPHWMLAFDHRDPKDKSAGIAVLIHQGASITRIEKEILKCDVVCVNCHAERTHRQRLNKEI